MNKDLEKEEILKKVSEVLNSDNGSLLLVATTNEDPRFMAGVQGDRKQIVSALVQGMLCDESFESIITEALIQLFCLNRIRFKADATVAATLKTLGIKTEDGKKRRSSRRYCLQGKYYRSKKKLYEALHQIECNI